MDGLSLKELEEESEVFKTSGRKMNIDRRKADGKAGITPHEKFKYDETCISEKRKPCVERMKCGEK